MWNVDVMCLCEVETKFVNIQMNFRFQRVNERRYKNHWPLEGKML
jgi:hypothetical protein